MTLIKYRLGELLERNTETNQNLEYGSSYVRGVLNSKGITDTKADIAGRDLSKFLVVRPGGFIFNHRVHDKLGLGFNTSKDTYIFTNDYVAFYVKQDVKDKILLPEYLYMWYLREEFDRYMLYKTYGSATLFFNWDNMCELEIKLPSREVQQRYVNIYKAMVANQESYDRGHEELKELIDSFLDRIKHSCKKEAIGNILQEIDVRNKNNEISEVQGINIRKEFMPSVADINGVNLRSYKVVKKGQFAYSGMQTGRDECIRIALYRDDSPIIISPAYSVFEVKDQFVLPEYIMMWFSRTESDRRGWFMSDSSIRTNLDIERFYEINVPVPDMKMQKVLVELYYVYLNRKIISEKLKCQIKDICPILIKGSLEEGK